MRQVERQYHSQGTFQMRINPSFLFICINNLLKVLNINHSSLFLSLSPLKQPKTGVYNLQFQTSFHYAVLNNSDLGIEWTPRFYKQDCYARPFQNNYRSILHFGIAILQHLGGSLGLKIRGGDQGTVSNDFDIRLHLIILTLIRCKLYDEYNWLMNQNL